MCELSPPHLLVRLSRGVGEASLSDVCLRSMCGDILSADEDEGKTRRLSMDLSRTDTCYYSYCYHYGRVERINVFHCRIIMV